MNQSECQSIDGVDDALDFEEIIRCMRNINFSEQEIELVLDQVVAILNLGNIEFAESDNDKIIVGANGTDEFL